MARRQSGTRMTRKHRAHMRREQRQRRWVLAGTIAVVSVVLGLVGFGLVKINIIDPGRPVLTVNGDEVSREEFRGRVRLTQLNLLDQYNYLNQLSAAYSGETEVPSFIQQQLVQVQTQLDNPEYLGQQIIDTLTTELLVRQEAARRGIEVTEEELDREIAHNFNFYPEGTPTARPTASPAPTRIATEGAEPTPEGPTPTIGPTSTPAPTSTPYTLQAYEQDYAETIDVLAGYEIPESVFREQIRAGMLQAKLQEAFAEDIPRQADQVWHEYLVVDTEQDALALLDRLDQGETWDDLVAGFSEGEAGATNNVDLGWLTQDDMARRFGEEYAQAVFDTPVGDVGGPQETSIGWQIFLIKGHEVRDMSDSEFQRVVQDEFQNWVQTTRDEADINLASDWASAVPPVPSQQLP
jgi:peptidyl-prolyl cis-trans isomerase D